MEADCLGSDTSLVATPICWAERSVAVDPLSTSGCSTPPESGVAIPVPGVLIGNSSSSGIGIGGPIFPLIEDPVFVLAGPSAFHFPGDRNLLIVDTGVPTSSGLSRVNKKVRTRKVLGGDASVEFLAY
jgi:hypothetical protein